MVIITTIFVVVINTFVGEKVTVVEDLLQDVTGETFIEVKDGSKTGTGDKVGRVFEAYIGNKEYEVEMHKGEIKVIKEGNELKYHKDGVVWEDE